jgi:hypothetical protein
MDRLSEILSTLGRQTDAEAVRHEVAGFRTSRTGDAQLSSSKPPVPETSSTTL